MSSMAQDAIEAGLDGFIAPDGREWCDSIYRRPPVNIEIWGEDPCENVRFNEGEKIDVPGKSYSNDYYEDETGYFSTFQEAANWAKKNPGKIITKAPDGVGFIKK